MLRPAIFTPVVLAMAVSFCTSPVRADSLRFFVDHGFVVSGSETRSLDGETTRTDSDLFSQEYRLLFDKEIYPHLTVRGGGSFVRADGSNEINGMETESTSVRKNPFLDLVMGSSLFSAGLGVNRNQDELRSSDGSGTLMTRDLYTAYLGWRPTDLPSLNVRFTRTETYDGARIQMDNVQDQFLVSSRYRPLETLDLSYSGNFQRSENFLGETEARTATHAGRATYADRFWGNRMSLSSTYSVSHRITQVASGGGGEIEEPASILGIKAYSEPEEVLVPKQPIDLFPVGASPGTAISAPLVLPVASPEALDPLHIALDSGLTFTVNVLRLRVEQELPAGLGPYSFGWKVFEVSASDEWQEVAVQSVEFASQFGNRYFELRFPTRRTQYLKVVAMPKKAGSSTINITGVEALLRQSAPAAAERTWQTSHLFNLASRIRLLDNPDLNYNFSLFYRFSDPGSSYRLFVSNGPSLRHRLAPWLVGNVQFARDDFLQSGDPENDAIYRYGAGLTATPLPTLSSNLSYSGRNALQDGERTVQNSFSLHNRAVLYPGVDLLLGGNLSFSSLPGGAALRSSQVNAGLNLVPHRTMTWNLGGSVDRSVRSGAGGAETASSARRGRISLSYSPVSAVNIFAATEIVLRDGDRRTLQNYGFNWAPFRDGNLQVGFSYHETIRLEDDALDRVISPSLSWQIRPATFLDLSHSWAESRTAAQETESSSTMLRLRAVF